MQQPHVCAQAVDRETLIRRHLPLVRRVARLHAGRLPTGVELGDLVSWGTVGLLAAVERYQPSRGAFFPAYARFRIRGAILDQLRRYDWTPRSVREKAAAVARAARDLERRLGRPATEEELAVRLGLPVAAYRLLLEEVAPVALVQLDDVGAEARSDRDAAGEGHEPLAILLARERGRLVADAVRRLPAREQLVLSLYYRDELTMKEVGAVLGVTESRVSQLHSQALLRVRGMLDQPVASRRVGGRSDRLKVRPRTTDGTIGAIWERRGSETPAGRYDGAGGSRGSGNGCEAAGTCSTRMPLRARSSRRSADAAATSEPARGPQRRHDADAGGRRARGGTLAGPPPDA
jgi:RNA polymerase sigma factor for flagellar operon FliA